MHRVLLPIIVSVALLALTNCKGEPNDPVARNCATERTVVEEFSLCLLEGWVVATQEFGDQGNFVILVKDMNSEEQGAVMQIHVKKDTLQQPVQNHLEFAERAVQIARENAPNYSPISTEPITINGEETILHIFEASPNETEGSQRYYQFVTISNGAAYGFTAVMVPDANEDMLKTLVDVFTNVQFL